MSQLNTLVIMAKKPVAGAVKSRLATSIGVARATGVYRTLLRTTLRCLAHDPRWQTILTVAPASSAGDTVWPPALRIVPQASGNLGARMQAIFNQNSPGPVIIIGSDIPHISANDIAHGFKLLGNHDVVFASAGDGGYWLVGARSTAKVASLFDNVRWSGPFALSDTLENAKGLSIAFAAEKYDIDTFADYQEWRRGYKFS